jgi:regulator of replication initiation timing
MKTKYSIILYIAMLTPSIYSQNSITNTLGTGGSFIIKDGTSTFFTLDQATGYLTLNKSFSLPYTNGSTIGVIYKGSESFIHDYMGPNAYGGNTFVGINSGNLTMNAVNKNAGEASWNSGFGMAALTSITTGHRNSAFGEGALQQNTSGYQNSAFGQNALNYNLTGNNNSAFGNTALVQNTGSNNSAFGQYAGNNVTTGSNLTLIGYNAQPSSGSAANEITLGNNTVTALRCNVQTITSLSDARDKKNIQDLQLGIDFLMKIKPRLFNWDKREWYTNKKSDGSKMQKTPTAGFIAQELETVQITEKAEWLNLVLKENLNRLEATPGNLLPIIVKAIQEEKAEIDKFKKENNTLAEENRKLRKDIAILSSSITEQVRKEVKAVLLKAAESGDAAVNVSMNTK